MTAPRWLRIHEAAHAIVAAGVGAEPRRVATMGVTDGRAYHGGMPRHFCAEHVAVYSAGCAAERIVCGHDSATAMEHAHGDIATSQRLLADCTEAEARAAAEVGAAMAEFLIKIEAHNVERLADRLASRSVIEGDALRDLCGRQRLGPGAPRLGRTAWAGRDKIEIPAILRRHQAQHATKRRIAA